MTVTLPAVPPMLRAIFRVRIREANVEADRNTNCRAAGSSRVGHRHERSGVMGNSRECTAGKRQVAATRADDGAGLVIDIGNGDDTTDAGSTLGPPLSR
ncbi:hypothetical protein QW131_17600 [Roseibium salinum]|nr:hypothetical protein [Roseibium salinum]